MTTVALLGTCDTKLQEILSLRRKILDAGASSVILIDVGRKPVEHEAITVSQRAVTEYGAGEGGDLASLPRGEVIKAMTQHATACVRDLHGQRKFSGIISAGGSGGSSLACAVMREALPIGFPKLMVSTVASGDTGPLIGETDLTMMYSVVDIAGANPLLDAIFANAAGAVVGMAKAHSERQRSSARGPRGQKRIGVTMFGVTTPGVDAARRHLEGALGAEVYVFHATGHGGMAMERLVRAGELDAVLDVTTTEVCDELLGGNMSAGPRRLEAAVAAGIPCVVSAGALDMVNFAQASTVPERFRRPGANRKLYEHNPTVTLMRTSTDECRRIGEFIVGKLTAATATATATTESREAGRDNVAFVIPRGGVSMLSTAGAAFEDREADAELFRTVKEGLEKANIRVVDDDRDINDEGFAKDTAQLLVDMIKKNSEA